MWLFLAAKHINPITLEPIQDLIQATEGDGLFTILQLEERTPW
jgi:hypothetical protein